MNEIAQIIAISAEARNWGKLFKDNRDNRKETKKKKK